jgi:hypothetical protein
MKTLTKIFLFSAIALASVTPALAFADQCQAITREQANAFVALVRNGDMVGSLCEPCGEAPDGADRIPMAEVYDISVEDNGEYAEIFLNDESIDLAYTYIVAAQTGTHWKLKNAAKLVGCPCTGVSDTLTVLKTWH